MTMMPIACPFCGVQPADRGFWFTVCDAPPDAHVFCLGCGVEGPHRETLDDAVSAWNTRVADKGQAA